MSKTPSKSTMTNKLDKICSQIIRSRGYCERCGPHTPVPYEKLQCAHIYSRTYRAVRWLLLNLLCLCASCHFWAHKNPTEFADWVRDHIGADNYTLLRTIKNSIKRWTVIEMQELYQALATELTTRKEY